MVISPRTRTSRVLSDRCTNTLSITTWKNSGEARPMSCRKNEPTSTSPRRWRYLWIAPRNQVTSKRRVMSANPARRVIRISPPSQTATNSSRVNKAGRDASGDWTMTLFPPALATTRNPPSRSDAMAGKGVLPSRDQSVRYTRALRPRSLAHRSISGAPILSVPSRCTTCPASAAMPWRCSSVTRATRPGSAGPALSVSMLMGALQGEGAGVRQRAAARAAVAGSPRDRRSAPHRDLHPARPGSTP